MTNPDRTLAIMLGLFGCGVALALFAVSLFW